jgi:hypothetical protein
MILKCFEIAHNQVIAGLPITHAPGGSFVAVKFADEEEKSDLKALLAPDIVNRFQQAGCDDLFHLPARLNRCNVEERGDLWLTPETADTANDALVLLSGLLLRQMKRPGGFTFRGTGCTILIAGKYSWLSRSDDRCHWECEAVLARVAPGGELRMELEAQTGMPIARMVWRKSRRYREVCIVAHAADGTVTVTWQPAEIDYL